MSKIWKIGVLVFTLFAVNSVYAQKEPSQNQLNQMLEKAKPDIEKLLAHPSVVSLSQKDFRWRIDEYQVVPLSSEKFEHPEGVFAAQDVHASLYGVEPLRVGIYSAPVLRVLNPQRRMLSRQECESVALSLFKETAPEFFAQGPLPPVRAEELPNQNGIWEFVWQRYRQDELPDTRIFANVRVMDGKITDFHSGKFRGEWKHNISPSQALKLATEEVAKEANLIDRLKVHHWYVSGGGGSRHYDIGFRAQSKVSGKQVSIGVTVDAMSGKVNVSHEWNTIVDRKNLKIEVGDSLPAWMGNNLLFVSNRNIKGLPDWVELPRQLFVQSGKEKPFCLTADLELNLPGFSQVNSAPTGRWMEMQWHGWTYALNLETGAYRVLGQPERAGETPTIDAEGKWAVVSGTGRDRNTDLDLLPDDLSARGEALGNRGRLVSKGDDHHPLFSPDGKWLYFVTTTAQQDKVVHALRRIPASLAHTTGLVTLKPQQIETLIAALPGDVQRLSIFPDGQNFLLQAQIGMFVLSIADKKTTPVAPKNLKDAEVGNAAIAATRDGWAGSGNGEVTFSGKTVDKDGKTRWRIYSCRFDGSGLKAWTPKENEPVEAYKFPGAPDGKTAIDLAKTWALKEIEFEDYLKRQRR